jgi:peptidoglycan/xylan/chitin deacetylase (PgdA/CDA1 family)
LLYHRVAISEIDTHRLCVSPQAFAVQAAHIAGTCHPLPLEQFVEGALAGSLPDRAIAVTFDDGYVDNIAPVEALAELGIPATLFTTTADLENTSFHYWWDVLEHAVLTPGLVRGDLPVELPEGSRTLRLESQAERIAAHRELHAAILPLDVEAREKVLEPFHDVIRSERVSLPRRMTRAELAKVSAYAGVRIGAHTEHHLMLPAHSAPRQRVEIASSLEALQRLLDMPVAALAYPYGAFGAETTAIAAELGVAIGVTAVAESLAGVANPLLIPRVDVAAHLSRSFEEQLDSVFSGAVEH